MKRSITFICDTCGSDALIFDTTSSWNKDTQSWEQEGEYDHDPVCQSDTCQGEDTTCHTIDVATGERVELWKGTWIPIADYQRYLAAQQEAWAQEKAERKALQIANENALILGQAYQGIAEGLGTL